MLTISMNFWNSIARFDPASTRSLAACEEHYVHRHTVWARAMLQRNGGFAAYSTARAVSRVGSDGSEAAPTRWRYVLLQRCLGADVSFDAETEAFIAEDHRNFLQNWHGYATAREVMRSAPRDGVAYLVEVPAECAAALDPFTAAADGAPGLVHLAVDTVGVQSDAEPIVLPGQRPVRPAVAEIATAAFVLVRFATPGYAAGFFAATPAEGLLTHRVELTCQFDERSSSVPLTTAAWSAASHDGYSERRRHAAHASARRRATAPLPPIGGRPSTIEPAANGGKVSHDPL
jgi:hypothetical protein